MFPSGSGGSRTHSIPGSKPRWSACFLPSRLVDQYPEQESNLQTLADQRCASVPGPSRSAGWRIWACRQWSRMESNHRFLDVTQVSLPLDHGTALSVDPPGVAPESPVCGTGVFLLDDEPISLPEVHASDLPARHAPKDLNPDQLGWNQSCYRYTRDTHLSTAEAVRLELTSRVHDHLFSRQVPHPAGCLPTASCGGRNRTCDLRFRKPLLYPTELRGHLDG